VRLLPCCPIPPLTKAISHVYNALPMADSSTAVLPAEPAQAKPAVKPRPAPKPRRVPRYNVVLRDDDDHTYAYVIEMLGKVFAYSVEKAFGMAKEVDTTGRVIVFTGLKEQAEFKRDQILAYGADFRMSRSKGSMSATIEPVDD
jgi:ATP-dependent Clp protease adaptor protein ClpS